MILYNVILPVCVALVCILIYHFAFRRAKKNVESVAETKVDNLIDTIPVLYYLEEMITDDNGIVVDMKIDKINRRCLDFTGGVSPEGKYSSDFFPQGQTAFLGAANSARQLGSAVNFQYFEKNTGVYYDGVAKVRPNTNFVEFFLIDSSNLHKTQEALYGLRRQMELALEISHITPIKMYVDTQLITCLELDRENSLPDHNLKNITVTGDELFAKFSEEDRAAIRHQLDELVEGKIKRVKYDMQCQEDRGDGMKTEWYEVRIVPGNRDDNGQLKTFEGSIQLVTKRKNMEKVLTDAKKKAEELNSLKSAFLANMSHEIRTPLNAIVGFSQVLADSDDSIGDDERLYMERVINHNSGVLNNMINDILDLTSLESGKYVMKREAVSVNRLCHHAIDLTLDSKAEGVSLRFETELPDDFTIKTDEYRVCQVLTNLLSNAMKNTSHGSIVLACSLTERMGMITFSVTDTGIGVPRDKQGAIFDRFCKLDQFKQGAGLGLDICRIIAGKLGGSIDINHDYAEGARFWFAIPI